MLFKDNWNKMANRKTFTQVKILSSLGWQDSTVLTVKAKHSKCPGKPLKLQLYKNWGLLLSSPYGSGRTNCSAVVFADMSSDLPNGDLVLQGPKTPMMVLSAFSLCYPITFLVFRL